MAATIPTLQGLMNPAQTLLMVIIICGLGLIVSVILLISKVMAAKHTPVLQTTTTDADLDRRRRALEIERMELEVQERRQRLAQQA